MPDRFGKYLTNVMSGTKANQAPGHSYNAAERHQRETILLDDGGPTAVGTTIGIASLRGGDVLVAFEILPSVAMAGVTISIGTKANPTKYGTGINVAAAGALVTVNVIDADPLTSVEEIFATTAGAALPTTVGGKLQFRTRYTHK